MKIATLHTITSFHTEGSATFLVGKNQIGEETEIVFDTMELLEVLDINHMKESLKKYIKEL